MKPHKNLVITTCLSCYMRKDVFKHAKESGYEYGCRCTNSDREMVITIDSPIPEWCELEDA